MKKLITCLVLMASLVLSACQVNQPASPPVNPVEVPAENSVGMPIDEPVKEPVKEPNQEPIQLPDEDQQAASPEEFANLVVHALKNQDMNQFSQSVHPSKGVRFTPYSYVQSTDLTFSSQQIAVIMSDSTLYHWGEYDGSGDPLDLTFADYFARFIYDQDYAQPEQISTNQRLGQGNSIDNSAQFYPNATIIEYHFSGFDPQYEGMDWRSLRIVLEQYNGQWFVVGIIHDEWTT